MGRINKHAVGGCGCEEPTGTGTIRVNLTVTCVDAPTPLGLYGTTVRYQGPGGIDETRTVGCATEDIYLSAPAGSWTITVDSPYQSSPVATPITLFDLEDETIHPQRARWFDTLTYTDTNVGIVFDATSLTCYPFSFTTLFTETHFTATGGLFHGCEFGDPVGAYYECGQSITVGVRLHIVIGLDAECRPNFLVDRQATGGPCVENDLCGPDPPEPIYSCSYQDYVNGSSEEAGWSNDLDADGYGEGPPTDLATFSGTMDLDDIWAGTPCEGFFPAIVNYVLDFT